MSRFSTNNKNNFGLSLIDVMVGTALMLLVFLGIAAAFQLGTKVVSQSKRKVIATAIANEYLEKIRNLSYDVVGVAGSYPDGVLESSTTTVRNNVQFTIETRVDYVADPVDGIADPPDTCPNDYKKAEVKVSWSSNLSGQVILTTDISPRNLAEECATGGGILSISVFDAYGLMVSFPVIEIRNTSTDELIKTATPTQGQHYFTLDQGQYKVVVYKDGFSTERTYGTNEITTPERPHLTVLQNKLTEASFPIDETSTFSIDTLSPWGQDNFSDAFLNDDNISDFSNIVLNNGEVELSKTAGVYFKDGTTDGDVCNFPGDNGDCGQSFTMGAESKQISQIGLYIKRISTPSDIYLEVRSASTTGPVLASSTPITYSGVPINFGWINFNLQNPVNLTAYIKYFLRLRSNPDSKPGNGAQGGIYWGYINATTSPPGYDGGEAFRYIDTQNYEQLNDYDFSFNIYDDQYVASGYLVSDPITPVSLVSWDELAWSDSEPFNTDIKYQLYYATGTNWELIPDSELTENSTGFDIPPIDLSALDIATYESIKIKGNLSTSDSSVSPSIDDWQVSWITSSATPIPNVSFLVQGEKIIGTDAQDNPVYKYLATSTSDGTGHINITNMEWDSYTFSLVAGSGLDLVDIDPSPQPITLPPDNYNQAVDLYLEAENSLLVNVLDEVTLSPIFAASVRLYNTGLGYDETQYTDNNGQTLFIPLDIATYNLEVAMSGYSPATDSLSVSGDKVTTIKLEQIE